MIKIVSNTYNLASKFMFKARFWVNSHLSVFVQACAYRRFLIKWFELDDWKILDDNKVANVYFSPMFYVPMYFYNETTIAMALFWKKYILSNREEGTFLVNFHFQSG